MINHSLRLMKKIAAHAIMPALRVYHAITAFAAAGHARIILTQAAQPAAFMMTNAEIVYSAIFARPEKNATPELEYVSQQSRKPA